MLENSTGEVLLRLRKAARIDPNHAVIARKWLGTSISIEIPGDPIPQMRHRRRSLPDGRVFEYDPQSKEKLVIGQIMKCQYKNIVDYSCYDVDFTFHLPYPNVTANNSIDVWLNQTTGRPDLDNLAKFYLDCGNDILWSDDKKIISLNAVKFYSENPRTVINFFGHSMEIDPHVKDILTLFDPSALRNMCNDIFNYLAYKQDVLGNCDGYSQSVLPETAMLLSKLADCYSNDLKRIAKKYPGYWKTVNLKPYSSYSNGKPRC